MFFRSSEELTSARLVLKDTQDTRGTWDRVDPAAVTALALHRCGLGSIPWPAVIRGLNLLVLYSTLGGFPRLLRFSPLTQNQHLIWFDMLWFQSDLWSTQLVKQEFSAKSKGILLLLVWWCPPSSSHRPLYHDYQHTWASSKESDLLWSGLGCGISFFSSSSTTVSCASTKLSNLLKSAKFSCFWSLTLSVSTASLLLELSSSFSGEQGSTLAGSTLSPI